jgi:hypothetical protein
VLPISLARMLTLERFMVTDLFICEWINKQLARAGLALIPLRKGP